MTSDTPRSIRDEQGRRLTARLVDDRDPEVAASELSQLHAALAQRLVELDADLGRTTDPRVAALASRPQKEQHSIGAGGERRGAVLEWPSRPVRAWRRWSPVGQITALPSGTESPTDHVHSTSLRVLLAGPS